MTENCENIDPNGKRRLKRKILEQIGIGEKDDSESDSDNEDYEKFTEDDLQKDKLNDTFVLNKEVVYQEDSDVSQSVSENNPVKDCGYLVGEEEVTPRENMPDWLVMDPYDEQKYNLRITKFKYRRYSGQLSVWLQDENSEDSIINSDWLTFSKRLTRLLKRYRDVLSLFYRHGMSPVDRRDFLDGVLFAFPNLELRYDQFRKMEGSNDEEAKKEGYLIGVTKTSLKKTRLTDLMMDRFGKQFGRENRLEKKARKAAGIPTPTKTKHAKFGTSLAMSERNRKKANK